MSQTVPDFFADTLEAAGFYRDGRPLPGVFDAGSLHGPGSSDPAIADRAIKYRSALDPSALGAQAVYELAGAPCAYFACVEDARPDAGTLASLRKYAWNSGLAPVLWVVTPEQIHIYNSYARPLPAENSNAGQFRLAIFQKTLDGLRDLNRFAGRFQFETGAFWHDKRISRTNRVDAELLRDLRDAQKSLASTGLEPGEAQALLLRAIFTAYLSDRGIIRSGFVGKDFGEKDVAELLRDPQSLAALFDWVARKFNGDLFPPDMAPAVNASSSHLKTVCDLLLHTNPRTGQLSFWPYRFDVIPIELISSIYEMFAHELDPVVASKRSTHYTPTGLVDLTLSQVFPHLRPNAKILDPACGSGVFLVESLRRLVASKVAAGEPWTRETVRDTLHQQLFGLDVSEGSVRITAFSLYLTALELDPAAKEASPDALRFDHLIGKNLFVGDVFDQAASYTRSRVFADREFDAIVGNPPWTKGEAAASGVAYCKQHDPPRPLADNNPDQAFLWRIGDFSHPGTRVGLIMGAKPFFSHTPEARRARSALLSHIGLKSLINLSDLHHHALFPTSDQPTVIAFADNRPTEPGGTMTLVAPKLPLHYRSHGLVGLGPQDVVRMPVEVAASDEDALKVASWGTARDVALIQRLRSAPELLTLRDLITRCNWPKPGAGVQWNGPWTLSDTMPTRVAYANELPAFDLGAKELRQRRPDARVKYKPSRPEIYRGPLLLATRGVTLERGFYATVVEEDLLYDAGYLGFPVPGSSPEVRDFLVGILNSQLCLYWLFLTGSSWGVERKEVMLIDILRLPIPDPDALEPQLFQAVAQAARHLRDNSRLFDPQLSLFETPEGRAAAVPQRDQLLDALNDAVNAAYGIERHERILIDDFLRDGLNFANLRDESAAVRPPGKQELDDYATELLTGFNAFFRTLGERMMVAEVIQSAGSPLQVVQLSLVCPSAGPMITFSEQRELREVLTEIASQLDQEVTRQVYSRRHLRVYAGDQLFIIKPAQRRFWSRAAALNDTDAILAEHLRRDRESNR